MHVLCFLLPQPPAIMASDAVSGEQVISTFNAIKEKYSFNIDLKEKQVLIIKKILSEEDVFVNLSTNFGKSLTYILPPLLKRQVRYIRLYIYIMHNYSQNIQCMRMENNHHDPFEN